MNQVIYEINGHTYIFRYPDNRATDMTREIGKMAGSPESLLNWYDAAKINSQIRQLAFKKDSHHPFLGLDR